MREVTLNDDWKASAHLWGCDPDMCKDCDRDIGIYDKSCRGCTVRHLASGIRSSAIDMLKRIREKDGPEEAEKMKRHMIEYRVAHGWMSRP